MQITHFKNRRFPFGGAAGEPFAMPLGHRQRCEAFSREAAYAGGDAHEPVRERFSSLALNAFFLRKKNASQRCGRGLRMVHWGGCSYASPKIAERSFFDLPRCRRGAAWPHPARLYAARGTLPPAPAICGTAWPSHKSPSVQTLRRR